MTDVPPEIADLSPALIAGALDAWADVNKGVDMAVNLVQMWRDDHPGVPAAIASAVISTAIQDMWPEWQYARMFAAACARLTTPQPETGTARPDGAVLP